MISHSVSDCFLFFFASQVTLPGAKEVEDAGGKIWAGKAQMKRGFQKGGGNWNQVLLKGGSRGAMIMTNLCVFMANLR